MDYEKKYKEALETARNLHKDAINMGENLRAKQCEIIFPELRESEDEKTRKEIISALKYANYEGVYNKHLAWLEKQAPKPKWTDEDDGMVAGIKIHLKQCLNNYAYTRYSRWLESLEQRMEE